MVHPTLKLWKIIVYLWIVAEGKSVKYLITTGCILMSHLDIQLKFGAVVAVSHPKHTLWSLIDFTKALLKTSKPLESTNLSESNPWIFIYN